MIGAGPAGLVAAETLARHGARVTIYEHKASPARKFLMAGRGGLNLTHSEKLERLIARYGDAAPALEPLIRAFPPQALRDWCASLGEETFVGSSGRVFPRSFKASPLLRGLLARLGSLGVVLQTGVRFEGFAANGAPLLRGADGVIDCQPKAVVLATGGASWARLGSDGAWVQMVEAAGVEVTPLAPANCGALVKWSSRFRDDFEGQPLKTIAVRFGVEQVRGDVVVTRRGLEGGPVYALSSRIRAAAQRDGVAMLHIDLRPDSTLETLTRKLSRRVPGQSLATFLRKAGLSRFETATMRESHPEGLPKDPAKLAMLVKNASIEARGVAGLERAISTAGGVAFDEVGADLMLRKLPGVFVCGEMLDFDAPTGGYLLQAAFSTGVAAGRGAARFLGLNPDS